jgi:oxygen-independent coproporphyrinogen-3 oxidase
VATAWRDLGIDRVSLGVQSLDSDVLDLLGRACAPDAAAAALERACRLFPRVSADWIVGPQVTWPRLERELELAAGFGVEHFSVYILELHAGTLLYDRVASGRVVLPPDERVEEIYLAMVGHLADLGFRQYEVSNFARPGAESRHNRNYWRGRPWLGLGPGAHGYWGRQRYANHRDLASWHADIAVGRLPVAGTDPLDPAARRLERLILGLRTTGGVELDRLPAQGLDIERGRREGLWEAEGGRLVLTARGFLRIDSIEAALARLTL